MIRVEKLSIRAGQFALDGIEFEVKQGEYGILMGRTGSGKTTILEAICGLRSIVAGRVFLMDRDVTHLKPAERFVGFVPQEGALFPTMTVREHLAFGPTVRGWKRKKIKQRVDELAELLELTHLLDRKPAGLSGGERQRVALGRALAARPGVLCLDEPLTALDEQSREHMYEILRSVQRTTEVTTLHRTYSREEAARLADRLLWLHDGVVEDIPLEKLNDPTFAPGGNGQQPGQAETDAVAET